MKTYKGLLKVQDLFNPSTYADITEGIKAERVIAKKIRSQKMYELFELVYKMHVDKRGALPEKLVNTVEALKKEPSAKFWIENRSRVTESFLAKRSNA